MSTTVLLQAQFVRDAHLPYEAATPDELAPVAADLAQTLVHIGVRKPEDGRGIEGVDFYRVPFTQARTCSLLCCASGVLFES
jgi:uncharacterized protein (DUF849 family)